jgi:hypothetical protein
VVEHAPLSPAVVDAVGALAAGLLEDAPAGNSGTHIRLGPYLARLDLADRDLAEWVPPHFAHLVDAAGPAHFTISARIDPGTLAALQALLQQHLDLVPATSRSLRWGQHRVHLEFDADGLAAFEVIDLDAGRAVHLCASLERIRNIVGIRPFLVLLRWWSEATPYLIVHAAAVGNDTGGVLIGGTPGAGKSTTALAAVGGTLRLVGDDIVLIGPDGIAHAIHATLRLREDMIERFGRDAWFGNEWTDWRQKPSQIVPSRSLDHLARSVPAKAIVLPRQGTGSGPGFRRVPIAAAMRAIAPATVIDLYRDPGAQLSKLARVLGQFPCYEFSRVPDLAAIRTAFEGFVEGVGA